MSTIEELQASKDYCIQAVNKVYLEWNAFALGQEAEILHLKQLCGQASMCLAAACSGRPGVGAKLVGELHRASAGVPIPPLEGMSAAEQGQFGELVRSHYPEAVFVDGRWHSSPEMVP